MKKLRTSCSLCRYLFASVHDSSYVISLVTRHVHASCPSIYGHLLHICFVLGWRNFVFSTTAQLHPGVGTKVLCTSFRRSRLFPTRFIFCNKCPISQFKTFPIVQLKTAKYQPPELGTADIALLSTIGGLVLLLILIFLFTALVIHRRRLARRASRVRDKR